MILSQEYSAMFALLRAGLWDRTSELEPGPDTRSPFPLTAEQWHKVYELSLRQTIVGLVYKGMSHLPDNLLPPETLLMQWAAKVEAIERRNKKMNAVLQSLLNLMVTNGLHPVLQKGQGVAAFYSEPLLRESGDIDLYFTKDEYDKATALMVQNGAAPEKSADGGCVYLWQGVEIEHHTRLIDIHNPFKKRYVDSLVGRYGFVHADNPRHSEAQPLRHSEPQAKNLPIPAPTLNLLMLNAHILKHMLGHGVGLRQFCDMAMGYHALCGSYNPQELETICRKTGLYKWSIQLHAFLMEYLGADSGDFPFSDNEENTADALLAIVLGGGNFGQYGSTRGGSKSRFGRKFKTFLSYWEHGGFSGKYACGEAFWTPINLIIGNIR